MFIYWIQPFRVYICHQVIRDIFVENRINMNKKINPEWITVVINNVQCKFYYKQFYNCTIETNKNKSKLCLLECTNGFTKLLLPWHILQANGMELIQQKMQYSNIIWYMYMTYLLNAVTLLAYASMAN